MSLTKKQDEAIRASVRTMKLIDGYLSTQPQGSLLAWNGGIMTWEELRKHVTSAEHHLRAAFRPDVTGIDLENTK